MILGKIAAVSKEEEKILQTPFFFFKGSDFRLEDEILTHSTTLQCVWMYACLKFSEPSAENLNVSRIHKTEMEFL